MKSQSVVHQPHQPDSAPNPRASQQSIASAVTQLTIGKAGVQTKKAAAVTIKNYLDGTGESAVSAGLFDKHHARAIQAAYLHVPFCFHKCHYCDFYSIVDSQDRQEQFVNRMIEELAAAADFIHEPVETIFVGGGTPTLLRPELWVRLLTAINQFLPRESGREFTVEANPETVTAELAQILVNGGVNRISIGCQSFNPTHLKTLERWHDPRNVHRSAELLRTAAINNINLDLIFAVPGQTLDEWLADLDEALSLQPNHISCYGLVYEPNTPLTVKMKAGKIQQAEQELEAEMYDATRQRLHAAGFEHYEISNWARPSHQPSPKGSESQRCRHNMNYWTNKNWWAFGPSASGHINGLRWKNIARLGEYLDHGPYPRVVDAERLDVDGVIGEEFMLGLRLIEGLELHRVEELLSRGSRGSQRRGAIETHLSNGLLERTDHRLRLRAESLMLADSVLSDLI